MERFWLKLLVLFWATNFFLHFAWEILQIPFYQGMTTSPHGKAVWQCTVATFGDASIALIAYLGAALAQRSTAWLKTSSFKSVAIYISIGILITLVLELLATEVVGRWAYADSMPTLPVLGTGLLPILQWIIVPLVSLTAVRLMYFGLLYHANCEQTYRRVDLNP